MQFFMPSLPDHLFLMLFKAFIKRIQLCPCQHAFDHGEEDSVLRELLITNSGQLATGTDSDISRVDPNLELPHGVIVGDDRVLAV